MEVRLSNTGGMGRRVMQRAASLALSCMPRRCSMAPLHLAASCHLEDHAIFIYPDAVYRIERTGSVAASSHQDITTRAQQGNGDKWPYLHWALRWVWSWSSGCETAGCIAEGRGWQLRSDCWPSGAGEALEEEARKAARHYALE